MHIQAIQKLVSPIPSSAYDRWFPTDTSKLYAGPNDGGIKRGDREDTGDDQAAPDELGTGIAEGTIDSTSLGGESSISTPPSSGFDEKAEFGDANDGMEIMGANDGRLGLTGLPDSPADDWAADTGETRNPND